MMFRVGELVLVAEASEGDILGTIVRAEKCTNTGDYKYSVVWADGFNDAENGTEYCVYSEEHLMPWKKELMDRLNA